jgi:hypothetical protein
MGYTHDVPAARRELVRRLDELAGAKQQGA